MKFDYGHQFLSKFSALLWMYFEDETVLTTACYRQTNGQVEKSKDALLSSLRLYIAYSYGS